MITELPAGFSFSVTGGGLTGIRDESGTVLHYSLNEEEALRALSCHERFGGGAARTKKIDKYVEL